MKKNDKPYVATKTECGTYILSIKDAQGCNHLQAYPTEEALNEAVKELEEYLKEGENDV